jgi:hypothetical protein
LLGCDEGDIYKMNSPIDQVLIHQQGLILVDGQFEAEAAEEQIALHSPKAFLAAKRIILLAILNQGMLNIRGAAHPTAFRSLAAQSTWR